MLCPDSCLSGWLPIAPPWIALQRFSVERAHPLPVAAPPCRGVGGVQRHSLTIHRRLFVHAVGEHRDVVAQISTGASSLIRKSCSVNEGTSIMPASSFGRRSLTPLGPARMHGSSVIRITGSGFFSLSACQYSFSSPSSSYGFRCRGGLL